MDGFAIPWILKQLFFKGRILTGKSILSPPSEASVPEGYLWKLLKCVYGLSDASRAWYLTVRDELMKLGAVPSKGQIDMVF